MSTEGANEMVFKINILILFHRLRLRHSLRHSKGENSSRSRRENNSSQPNESEILNI
jgi:hypothetical protein